MFSRRTILAGFGLAPFAAIAATVPFATVPQSAPSIAPRVRARSAWTTRLEADGSSTLVRSDTGERYLDAWLKVQDPDDEWGNDVKTSDLGQIFEADKQAVIDRSNPWRELTELQEKLRRDIDYDLEVRTEAVVYSPGVWFENDIADHSYITQVHHGMRYHDGSLIGQDDYERRVVDTPKIIVSRRNPDHISILDHPVR